MKLLKRNLITFTYTPYLGKTEVMKDGKHTGKFDLSYGEAIDCKGNISVPNGQDTQQWFGLDTPYTHVLLMEDPNTDIRENGLIKWKGNVYDIKAVRPSLNHLAVALKKRIAGDA